MNGRDDSSIPRYIVDLRTRLEQLQKGMNKMTEYNDAMYIDELRVEIKRLEKALDNEGKMRERAVEGEICYRRRADAAESSYQEVVRQTREGKKRIEELELKDAEENECLRERILTLQKERDFYFDRACNGTPEATGTWIRYEQIDAAWKLATNAANPPFVLSGVMVEVLKMLGIERCERCDGTGLDGCDEGDGGVIETWECSNCNGKGYIIK